MVGTRPQLAAVRRRGQSGWTLGHPAFAIKGLQALRRIGDAAHPAAVAGETRHAVCSGECADIRVERTVLLHDDHDDGPELVHPSEDRTPAQAGSDLLVWPPSPGAWTRLGSGGGGDQDRGAQNAAARIRLIGRAPPPEP